MKSIRTILGLIRKADQKFDFFHEKDKVMIGISGGKDSMLLAYALKQYQAFKAVNFSIVPVILDLGFPGFDATPIKEYLATIGMDLKVIDSKEVFKILKAQQKDGKHLPCSICSRMKKAAINKVANELGCNKVAFAHHGDDAIETLFMNEIFGGRVASFQPKMFLERAKIEFVRPLILVHESEIIKACKEEGIPFFPSHCPNDGVTVRSEMKELLKGIYEKYPSAKKNFFLMMENYEQEQLYYHDIFYKIERKDMSFKPVITAKDARLENDLRLKLNLINNKEGLNRYIIYNLDKPIGIISFIRHDELTVEIHEYGLVRKSETRDKIIAKFVKSNLERNIYPLKLIINRKAKELR